MQALTGKMDTFREFIEKRYGSDIIYDSDELPSNNITWSLNKQVLLTKLKDNIIMEHSTSWSNNYVKVADFINFIKEKINTRNTKGIYHDYMDIIHSFYSITVTMGLPNYSVVNETLKNEIKPKRIEYLFAWWIINKIRDDPFLSKYMNTLLKPTYQEKLATTDNKYYDIGFEEINVLIEINESSNNHDANSNDILKYSLAKVRGKFITYFQESEYKLNSYSYLTTCWNRLKEILTNGLLITQKENFITVRREYLLYRYYQVKNEEYLKINEEVKKYYDYLKKNTTDIIVRKKLEEFGKKQKLYRELIFMNNDELPLKLKERLNTFSDWYKSDKDTCKFVIPVQTVCEYLKINKKNKLNFIKSSWFKDYCGFHSTKQIKISPSNEDLLNMYFSWCGIVNIFLNKDENGPIQFLNDINDDIERCSTIILDQLLFTEKVYEEIVIRISKHYELIILKDKEEVLQFERNTKKYYEEKNKELKASYEKEFNILQTQDSLRENKLNNFCRVAGTMIKHLSDIKVDKKMSTRIELVSAKYKTLCEIHNYKKNSVTLRKTIGASIINELDIFPIYWSENSEHKIPVTEFIAICRTNNFTEKTINKLLKELAPPHTSSKNSEYIFGIINKEYFQNINNKQIITHNDIDKLIKEINQHNDEENSENDLVELDDDEEEPIVVEEEPIVDEEELIVDDEELIVDSDNIDSESESESESDTESELESEDVNIIKKVVKKKK